MGKLLTLILIIFVIYVLWRGFSRVQQRTKGSNRAKRLEGEPMVNCSQCGVHIPLSEAVASQGRYFCTEEHRQLFSS
jgi:uncharacterized protein